MDPFYGKNVWPDDALKQKFTAMNECMYDAALVQPHPSLLRSDTSWPQRHPVYTTPRYHTLTPELHFLRYDATLRVLRGCDEFLEADHGPLAAGRRSLEQIATDGTALAGRWIWYDSAFSQP